MLFFLFQCGTKTFSVQFMEHGLVVLVDACSFFIRIRFFCIVRSDVKSIFVHRIQHFIKKRSYSAYFTTYSKQEMTTDTESYKRQQD
jgi:hypothetical protein